jgi:hypothetical protein
MKIFKVKSSTKLINQSVFFLLLGLGFMIVDPFLSPVFSQIQDEDSKKFIDQEDQENPRLENESSLETADELEEENPEHPLLRYEESKLDAHHWEMYNVTEDFAENYDIVADNQAQLIEMLPTWYVDAGRYVRSLYPVESVESIPEGHYQLGFEFETTEQSDLAKGKDTPRSPQLSKESNTNEKETTVVSEPTIEDIAASDSNRWHFLFQPYLYLPITIYGDTTVGRLSRDFDIDSEQIKTTVKDDLNFAFLGDIQAWSPNYRVGIIANVDYLALSDDNTINRPVRRPGFAEFIPTEFNVNVDNQEWNVSLAAAYRFYDQSKVNPQGVSTEFDLGLVVFDVFGGLNITSVSTDLELSTDFGGKASFDNSTTVVSPVLGGRLRLNVNPKLAWVTTGSVAGFGISGLSKWNVMSGIDWMFSGNTSLGLGYRFAHTSYNSELEIDKDFGVTLNQNGPYLSFSFRF